MLVIEHDMPLIMSISDRGVLPGGRPVIAEGTPDEVRNDPRSCASYLGTDERAIHAATPRSPWARTSNPSSSHLTVVSLA